jgi:hypothetical protein
MSLDLEHLSFVIDDLLVEVRVLLVVALSLERLELLDEEEEVVVIFIFKCVHHELVGLKVDEQEEGLHIQRVGRHVGHLQELHLRGVKLLGLLSQSGEPYEASENSSSGVQQILILNDHKDVLLLVHIGGSLDLGVVVLKGGWDVVFVVVDQRDLILIYQGDEDYGVLRVTFISIYLVYHIHALIQLRHESLLLLLV